MPDENRPLRFGIMCAGTTFPEWEAHCIRTLVALENVVPALLIVDPRNSGALATPSRTGFGTAPGFLQRKLATSPKSMKPVDLSAELADIPTIERVARSEAEYSAQFCDEDLDRVREHDLDFILRFGFDDIRGEIFDVPRYGVWSFHHGDDTKYRGSPPAFWEIYHGDPATGAILHRLTNHHDGGVVLKKGFFPTANYSYAASLNRVLTDSAVWPAQVCTDIHNGNAQYLDDLPRKTNAPIYRSPTNSQLVMFVLKCWKNLAAKLFELFFRHEEWNVGVVDAPIDSFVGSETLPKINWLRNSDPGSFIADPFGFVEGNKNVILVEGFDYRTYRGIISKVAGSDTGAFVNSGTVFDEQHHLSYPYLLRHEGHIYCIPETSEARYVKLFRATEGQTQWEEVATLITDFAAVDSTVINHDGRWWLFCTNAEDGRYDKLHLWHSDSLFGPWESHKGNPVKIDIRSARPAGTPFTSNGRLYRPAQDCTFTYGRRISLNCISKLSTTGFEEEICNTIGPDTDGKYCDGMHTLSQLGEKKTLIDGKRHRFYAGGFWHATKFVFRSATSKIGF